jgi:BASS family bile acid:Na+ symporter
VQLLQRLGLGDQRYDQALAFVLGLMASQRNMGLMLAATGGALPDFTWLYFALAQFPVYLSPLLFSPLARRVQAGRPRP